MGSLFWERTLCTSDLSPRWSAPLHHPSSSSALLQIVCIHVYMRLCEACVYVCVCVKECAHVCWSVTAEYVRVSHQGVCVCVRVRVCVCGLSAMP